MTPFINLLPWRRQRRQQQLRYWSLLAVGCLLFVALTGSARFASTVWQKERQRIEGEYLSQTGNALARKNQQAGMQAKLQKAQQQRLSQRRAIRIWEVRLTHLAELLPASLWLTSLSASHGRLVLKGNAEKPEDVQALEQNLHQLAEVTRVAAGGIKRDKNGLLLFTFTLTMGEKSNAV